MDVIENFRSIEKRIGFTYASVFYEFLNEFLKKRSEKNFNSLFKKFHFCSEDEIRYATEELLPEEFFPFFVEEQNGYSDYYCFEKDNSANKNRVVVFSQDAIVQKWESYDDFLHWVEGRLESRLE